MKYGLMLIVGLLWGMANASDAIPLRLYVDADRTGVAQSGRAIELGIRLALAEHGDEIAGRPVELVIRDHRGNATRSRDHLLEFDDDPTALAVFCGLHSPPVLYNLALIQEKEILLLDPWAAAGPITRAHDEQGRNWVFRVSVDDTKAGDVLVAAAIDGEGFQRPALLLEGTGWGASNKKTMTRALAARGLTPVAVVRFDWKIGAAGAREMMRDIIAAKADVVLFVGNAPEGKTFVRAMADLPPDARLPLRSHWGITGGDFFSALGAKTLVEEVDLAFLQTRFSFLDPLDTPVARRVWAAVQALDATIKTPKDIEAPDGLIHAYDMTKILLAAVAQAGLVADMDENRRRIRTALETLHAPVPGLVKTYTAPFAPYDGVDTPDAHEALGVEDFRMARYTADGGIRLLPAPGALAKKGEE